MRRRERVSVSVSPAGVPELAAGWHGRPEDGACFMEYASVLAGERFSDHPRCTHPGLAAACRAINDLTSDAGRGRLARHVPEVIGACTRDPRTTVVVTLACLEAAETYSPEQFARARAKARQRLDGLAGSRWPRARAQCGGSGYGLDACLAIYQAVRVVADAGGDDALHALLVEILDAYRRVDPSAPAPAHAPQAAAQPDRLPAGR